MTIKRLTRPINGLKGDANDQDFQKEGFVKPPVYADKPETKDALEENIRCILIVHS